MIPPLQMEQVNGGIDAELREKVEELRRVTQDPVSDMQAAASILDAASSLSQVSTVVIVAGRKV